MSKVPQWAIDLICETFGCYNPRAHEGAAKMLLKGAAWQRGLDAKIAEGKASYLAKNGLPQAYSAAFDIMTSIVNQSCDEGDKNE